MKHFVITETRTYYFSAPSFETAKKLAAIPQAISGVHVETERVLTCQTTGEEETLP